MGLIQEKDAGMIHAWRGIGKTHFVLSLTWALVSGGRFLRFEVPESRGVLVIDGEMPREDLQERLKRIVSGSPGPRLAPLRILAADMFERGLASLAASAPPRLRRPSMSTAPLSTAGKGNTRQMYLQHELEPVSPRCCTVAPPKEVQPATSGE
jgi:hypothetical protein